MSAESKKIIWKGVALPAEHGGWAFIYEPVLLGLLAAPSTAGLLLGFMALFAFLLHQPLKVALKDRLKGKRHPRTRWAVRFATGYTLVAFLLLLATLAALANPFRLSLFLPLLLALPFALLQARYDLANESRSAWAEISGVIALSAFAASIALAGGMTLDKAFGMWGVVLARAVPSILYIRDRLQLEHGQQVSPYGTLAAHLIALLLLFIAAAAPLVPALTIVGVGILLARAALGISRFRRPTPARVLGFREIGYGILYIGLAALGYRLG